MRLRTVVTAALLLCCVLSASPALATPRLPASVPPAAADHVNLPLNLDVERAQLRALIRERHRLVARLAAEEAQRSQILTLAMLSAADAAVTADAATLKARIDALRAAQARAVARARVARARALRRRAATDAEQWLVLAAPGSVWSPLARGASAGPLAWAPAVSPTSTGRASLAPPLAMSLTALTSWAGLLPTARTPIPATATAGPTLTVPPASGTAGPPRAASIGDPAFVAPSHGGLLVASGSDGAAPPGAANPAVAAAVLTPVPTVASAAHRTARHAARHRQTDTPATRLARLTTRWQAVSDTLRRLRTLEAWISTHSPAHTLTPNDIILSPQMLSERIDHWDAAVPLTDTTLAPVIPAGPPPQLPAALLGATLAVSATLASGLGGVGLDAVLAAQGGAGRVDSTLSDAATGAGSTITAPVSLTSTLPFSVSSAVTDTTAVTPDATGLLTPTEQSTLGTDATATAVAVQGLATAAPDITATPSITAGVQGSGVAMQGDAITATTPLTAQAALTVSVASTPRLTVTDTLSPTAPLTVDVTLPATATDMLAPPDFAADRAALETVLSQGAALFDHLKATEAGAMQQYRAQLAATVRLNTALEQRWYARVYAYNGYLSGLAAYRKRVAAYDAYAHRLHVAQLRHQQWVQESAAWTDYARKMAAYKVALASRRAPLVPISGTVPATDTAPLPVKPVMPPFPGPEPPPFTEAPPAWPGSPPPYVAPAGLEPEGYPLPVPPEDVPPWDGDSPIISVASYGGMAAGVIAAGREETTQAALLADGALDGVPAYDDPIKGIITTYWGGQTVFQSFHPGVDIAAPMYTPVHAAAAGLVTYAGYAVPGQRHYSYGLCVVIKHNDHFSTLYAHMDDLKYGLQVHSGDIVQAGQVIGYVGMTGWTTGPHLHFELRENNVQFNPLLLIPNPQD